MGSEQRLDPETAGRVPPGPLRTGLIRLALVLVPVLFVLLLSESLFRIYLFGWSAFSVSKLNSVQGLTSGTWIRDSDELLFELRPNLDTTFKMVDFGTNSRGLRDQEYSIEKPPGTYRVAVVGDSITMGAGVEFESTYHTRLEERFNRASDGTKFEFINFGVGGYSLRQYVAVVEHRALRYQPDLILIGFCPWNDQAPTHNDQYLKPNSERPQSAVRPGSSPFFGSFLYQYGLKRLILGANRRLRRLDTAYVNENFARLSALSARAKMPIVIAYLFRSMGETEQVEELARSHQLDFVDVTEQFDQSRLSDYYIYTIDHHPNGEANRIFADAIYDHLKAEHPHSP